MMDNSSTHENPGMKMIEKKSGVPLLAFGAVWLIYAFLFPLYKFSHFAIAGLLSAAAFVLLNKMIPAKVEYVAAPAVNTETGNQAADSLLREGDRLLGEIRSQRQAIKNQVVADKIVTLEGLITRIFAFVADNPGSADSLRKFMNYYLPTLLKLVGSYQSFESQGIQGENITSGMSKIEAMLDTMAAAFGKQLDALFADRALDVSTDITVMEGMLAQEGLSDGQNTLKLN